MRFTIDATTWATLRGYGRFTREIVRAMTRSAPEHHYVVCVDETVERSDLPDAVEIVRLRTAVPPARAAAHDGRRSTADLARVAMQLRRTRPDVFFFPTVYTYVPVPTWKPVVVSIHDAIPERNPTLTFATRRARWFWQGKLALARAQADMIVTVSTASRDGLMACFGMPAARVAVVPEAPAAVFTPRDRAAHQQVRARIGVPATDPMVLYVGGLSPHKNLPRLVEAVARASRDLAMVPLVVLAGDVTGDVFHTDRVSIEAAAARAGISKRICFAGFVPDEELAALYSGADVVVLPSLDEGFGLPAIEAMACGGAVAVEQGRLAPRGRWRRRPAVRPVGRV